MLIIGFVVKLMSKENVLNIIHVLIQLIQHTDWTTRHGGLLGLKYLLVVRIVSCKILIIFNTSGDPLYHSRILLTIHQ